MVQTKQPFPQQNPVSRQNRVKMIYLKPRLKSPETKFLRRNSPKLWYRDLLRSNTDSAL